MWYDTVAHSHVPALRCACDTFGADRLLLGTDVSYELGDAFVRAVDFVSECGLSADEVNGVLGENAAGLFDLPLP